MNCKTVAIVLRTVRYGDSRMIVDLFTREQGRLSFMVSVGRGGGRSGMKKQLFQPLTLLAVEADVNERQQLHRLRSVELLCPWQSLLTAPDKVAIALFVAEFLCYALRGEQRNERLFDYVRASLEWLDSRQDRYANFHLVFLMRLSRFLGFFPNLSPLTSHPSLPISHPSPPTSHPSPITSHPSLPTSHPSPLTSHPSLPTSHPSPITSHPSPLTSHPSLPTSHPSPLTSHPSPPTSHPSPLTSHLYFDLRAATFCSAPPPHHDYLMPEEAGRVRPLMRMDFATMHLFRLTRAERNRLLEVIEQYYRLHLPAFPELRSLPVLREMYDSF